MMESAFATVFFPLLWVCLVVITLLLGYFVSHTFLNWWRERNLRADLPVLLTEEHEHLQANLHLFADLCRLSYASKERLIIGTRHVVKCQEVVLLHNVDNLMVWCPRVDRVKGPIMFMNHKSLFIVVRGSHTVDDWVCSDVQLIKAAMGMDNNFEQIIERYFRFIREALDASKVNLRGGMPTSIIFSGHSLGACVAEAIVMRYKQNILELFPNCSISAVTFDTPGQPVSFRKRYLDCVNPPHIVTLNSVPNIVNTLNRPCASWFYACGIGSAITPIAILSILTNSLLRRLFEVAIYSHQMTVILNHIEESSFHMTHVDLWPVFSGTILHFIPMLKNSLVLLLTKFKTNQVIIPSPPNRPARTPLNDAIDVKENMRFTSVVEMEPMRPYTVSILEDFYLFIDGLGENDIVLPLIGKSGVGKTSIMKKFLNLSPNDDRLLVGMSGCTTLRPIFAHVTTICELDAGKLFLVDMPGIGVEENAGMLMQQEFLVFLSNTFATISRKAGIPTAIFVVRGDFSDVEMKAFAQCLIDSKWNPIFCFNVHSEAIDFASEIITEAKRKFQQYLAHWKRSLGGNLAEVVYDSQNFVCVRCPGMHRGGNGVTQDISQLETSIQNLLRESQLILILVKRLQRLKARLADVVKEYTCHIKELMRCELSVNPRQPTRQTFKTFANVACATVGVVGVAVSVGAWIPVVAAVLPAVVFGHGVAGTVAGVLGGSTFTGYGLYGMFGSSAPSERDNDQANADRHTIEDQMVGAHVTLPDYEMAFDRLIGQISLLKTRARLVENIDQISEMRQNLIQDLGILRDRVHKFVSDKSKQEVRCAIGDLETFMEDIRL